MSGGRGPRPLRVLYIVPRGLGGKGGIERQADYLAAAWQDPAWPDRQRIALDFAPTRGGGSIVLSPLLLLRAMLRLARMRLQGGPLLLHLSLSIRGSTLRKLVLAGWSRLLGVPYILQLHGGGYDEFYAGLPGPGRWLVRRMFLAARHVLLLGSPFLDTAERVLQVPTERLSLLPNAVPDPWAGAPARPQRAAEGPCRILFLGLMVPAKGVPELIAALAELAAEPSAWQAVLAGNGEVERFRQEAAQAGLAGQVEMPGWVDLAQAQALLAQATIFVLPSHVENLPVSVLEAASHGLPIIATPVGAVPDFFRDGENALLVPPADAPALAAALRRLLQDPALRARLGAAARATFLEHFSIAAQREVLAALYLKVAAEG